MEKRSYQVIETNPDETQLAASLGISKERKEYLDEISKNIVESQNKTGQFNTIAAFQEIACNVENDNEFAFFMYALGRNIQKCLDPMSMLTSMLGR